MKASYPLLVACSALLGAAALNGASDQGAAVSYDRDVAPILGQKCFKCHGADAATVAAGLRLDAFSPRAIVRGRPDQSLMMRRIAAHEMPPADSGVKPLSTAQIDVLRRWISQGAKYERHWSYVAPVMPPAPRVKSVAWPVNAIDRFVLARLEAAGMKPEPEADRDALAYRAAETLTGLPPTSAELARFRADRKPGAYERYVDRLLASTAYGEHQARYWLDAVRYGDTHGLQLDNERGVFPYRDWVVRAFNQDLPYDKFVEWQLAGDLEPQPTTEQLIATGYVRMNLTTNEGGAIAEEFLARNTFDRLETTATTLFGITIQCARCHDHKYDPFKQRDYYAMYAFFNSTADEPLDGNLTLPPPVTRAASPDDERRLREFDRRLAAMRARVDQADARRTLEARRPLRLTASNWSIGPVAGFKSFDEAFDRPAPGEPGGPTATWKPFDFGFGRDARGIIRRDAASVIVRGAIQADRAGVATLRVGSDDGVKVWVNGRLVHANKIGRGLNTSIDVVRTELREGDNEVIFKVVNAVGPDGLSVRVGSDDEDRIAKALATNDLGGVYLELGPKTPEAIAYRATLAERAKFEASIPMTLIARERAAPRPTFILKRGQYDQKGEPVTRALPAALGPAPKAAKLDRLAFARWATSPTNPLTARVFVNRVWQQHFGTGIVRTSEDFGSQGEWPSNPALLDYLAADFMRGGWSVKRLNRLIVTSAAYRQSSCISPTKLAADPENRLISRGPRFRLDAEAIRDKALFASGLLVRDLSGRGFKPYQPDGIWENVSDPASATHFYVQDHGKPIYRRSMYLFWKRTAPPPAMLNFDAPLRDTCVVRRATTNTPLQALTTENEPAFVEAARAMASSLLVGAAAEDRRIARAFDVAMGRSPKAAEVAILRAALARWRKTYSADPAAAKRLIAIGESRAPSDVDESELASWTMLCSTLMNTDEFLTVH